MGRYTHNSKNVEKRQRGAMEIKVPCRRHDTGCTGCQKILRAAWQVGANRELQVVDLVAKGSHDIDFLY